MTKRHKWQVDIPDGENGAWRIDTVTVDDKASELTRLRAMINGHGRYTPPGEYKMLYRNGTLVMSDTPDECRDHHAVIYEAKGHVLIAGLGIGMVLKAVASKPEVTKVTVIELSQDLIDLVWPHYEAEFGEKIEVICADIMEWKPAKGTKYDVAWFDIWDTICGDNIDEMSTLHRRYGKRADWKGSWCHYEVKREVRLNKEHERNWRV